MASTVIPDRVRDSLRLSARVYGVSPGDILSRSRIRKVVDARSMAIGILRIQGFSLPQIGRWLNRHHTTVLHHLKSDA